jgi:N-acetylneuraminic acid mutarotase
MLPGLKLQLVAILLSCNAVRAVSSDFTEWEEVLKAAPWAARAIPHGGVFNNSFYVMGGRTRTTTMHNDVWRSEDGKQWEQLVKAAPWAARSYLGVNFVDETMVLFGGQGPSTFYNDVWHSDDGGIHWKQVVEHAPWEPRAGFKSIVVNGTILLFSGGTGNFERSFFGDVWASADKGLTWTLQCAKTPWSGRAGAMVVPIQGTLFLMVSYINILHHINYCLQHHLHYCLQRHINDCHLQGGDNDKPAWSPKGPNFNDVWSSKDLGKTWSFLGNASWSVRTGHQCTGVDNKAIYCIGGAHQSGETTLMHDVWKSADGLQWVKVADNAVFPFSSPCASLPMTPFVPPFSSSRLLTTLGTATLTPRRNAARTISCCCTR